MFDTTQEVLSDGRIHKYRITGNDKPLSYADVLNLWQSSSAFRSFFITLLSESPFLAYRWETPALTKTTTHGLFEFVLHEAPGLERTVDGQTISAHFTDDDIEQGITVFENLGKDAILVVPSPRGSWNGYGHLAAFIRNAPAAQIDTLWRIVGETDAAGTHGCSPMAEYCRGWCFVASCQNQ
ncbi:MAG: hypothetical protein HC851_24395 [Acaryochloris sp. RU_4_1]|nr:hypothetical protein [Acaryochloris sp. RU_4_1]